MAFDSLALAAVAAELRSELADARIQKIHQPDKHTLLLRYHGQAGRGCLLLSSHPQNGRLHKTAAARENPEKAPLFAMVLRKWLDGARIIDLAVTDCERVAELRFLSRNELGDSVRLRLIIEIMGKHSNIILVDEKGVIIDGIRRYGSSLSRYREVLPGRTYREPPKQLRTPLPPADEETLAAVLYAAAEECMLAEMLQRRIAGISPLLAQHISLQAGLQPNMTAEQLGAADIDNLMKSLQELRQRIATANYQPTLLLKHGKPADFAAISPLSWRGDETLSMVSMNEAVDAFYAAREAEQQFLARQKQINKQLSRQINRLNRKISLQETDLAQCEAADEYKAFGDLLAANLYHLRKGMDSISLPSFYQPEQQITIPLEPALSPQENVQRYYHRYAKAKHSYGLIEQQLQANQEELAYALGIEQALQDSERMSDLTELERECIHAGYLPPLQPAHKTKRQNEAKPTALPPRCYRTSDGLTVLIGRNNRQNDRLSLRQAAPDDLWLHAQKIPGSHVILVTEGREAPESSIVEAASWAAWFSKARDSGQVAVDILPAGKLKKPQGARPGFVVYTGQRTIYTKPAPPPTEAALAEN